MAVFTAPGVCRFTINMTIAGAACSVVQDVDIDLNSTPGVTREEAIRGTAGRILNHWADDIMPLVVDDVVHRSVSWVDLNSEDGYTGEITSTDDTTLPVAGGVTDAPSSTQVALLVTKRIENRRRNMRDGRMYVPGVSEAWTAAGAPNTIGTTVLEAFDAAFVTFLEGVQTGGGLEPDVDLCVVHTHTTPGIDGGPPTIEYVGKSNIGSYDSQSIVATQRRRLQRAL